MNKTKSLLSAVAFAGAMLGTSGGYAAVVSHAPATITLTDGAAYFGATFGANSMGSFADKFSFTLNHLSSVAGLVSSISQSASDGVDITGFDLFNSGGMSLGGTQLHSGMVDLWTVASAHLVPDTYYFLISGNVLSNAAVSYSGNISVVAVPELENYAMLLAGMGVVGFLARRRKIAVGVA